MQSWFWGFEIAAIYIRVGYSKALNLIREMLERNGKFVVVGPTWETLC